MSAANWKGDIIGASERRRKKA